MSIGYEFLCLDFNELGLSDGSAERSGNSMADSGKVCYTVKLCVQFDMKREG